MSDEPLGDDTGRYLRTELLERIAHELRGPVGVTLGALDELEHSLGSEVVEQNRILFAMARRGARRVLRTAERLTRTALLESAPLKLTLLPTDVRGIVEQAAQEAEGVEGRSSVRLMLSVPSEPCPAEVDANWLGLALTELIAQAIRCARREVEVVVSTAQQEVRVTVRDDRSVVTEPPAQRFVSLTDRRDAALGWPLICDVVRAHGAQLESEELRIPDTATAGYRVAMRLRTPLAV